MSPKPKILAPDDVVGLNPNTNPAPPADCSTCMFSRLLRGRELECHREVPTVRVSTPATSPRTMWPSVLPSDWCGEYVKLGP